MMKLQLKLNGWLYFIILTMTLDANSYSSENTDCECSSKVLTNSVRHAERIFSGQIESAKIKNDELIEFVVTVDDVVRGLSEPKVTLMTPLPSSCGIAVRLGFHDLFVLAPGSQTVEPCSASGRNAYHQLPFLRQAIQLAELGASDPEKSVSLLNKTFYEGHKKPSIEEFFSLVQSIDKFGYSASFSDDRIEYHSVVIHLKDDRFVKAEQVQ